MKTTMKHKTLFLLLGLAFAEYSLADDAVGLNEIVVKGNKKTTEALGKEKVKRAKLDENLVSDINDMVRYDPGVSVVEGGRAGSNGFAIRGVDKDRVAITVDGLDQAESRSSSAFQDLFGAYGNYNTNRNAAELENISEVVISKGADSVAAGSGALGGAIMYKTKSASEYLQDKDWHVGVKSGYVSKSSSWLGSTTLAGRAGPFDGLFVFTRRHGHETKNYEAGPTSDPMKIGVQGTGTDKINMRTYSGVARGTVDPQDYASKSTLLKLGYNLNDSNRFSYVYEDFRQDRNTNEYSNLFEGISAYSHRYRNDVSYRKRWGVEFENTLESKYAPWDTAKWSFDKQNIDMTTMTWDMPINPQYSPSSAEAMFRRRVLDYRLSQFKFEADKHFDLSPSVSLDTNYGGGHIKKKAGNSNLEYHSLIYYPQVLRSGRDTKEFLLGSKSSTRYYYLSNLFRFGQRAKLNLAARHDSANVSVNDDGNLMTTDIFREAITPLLGKKSKFSATTYAAAFDFNVNQNLTLQAKYSTGFRIPTTDELYFTYPSDLYYVQANPDLKAERAKNVELGIDVHGSWGNLKLSGFRSNYRDFIDFREGISDPNAGNVGAGYRALVNRNENRASATIKGLELKGHWNLDSIGLPEGTFSALNLTYQKGHGKSFDGSGDVPLNAMQPFNGVFSLGYRSPEDKWSLVGNLSYFAKKKDKDTVLEYGVTDENKGKPNPYARHGSNIFLMDVIGHYRFGKHVTLRAGVFNLFNRKYYTWDSLRSIREFGTVNRVDRCSASGGHFAYTGNSSGLCPHYGIDRFSAPGRNYSMTLEAKF